MENEIEANSVSWVDAQVDRKDVLSTLQPAGRLAKAMPLPEAVWMNNPLKKSKTVLH
jgi:hypothetical protein